MPEPDDQAGWGPWACLTLLALVLTLMWPGEGQAHRRGGLALSRPGPAPMPAASSLGVETLSSPLALTPEAYLQRLTALEKAGRLPEAWEVGLGLLNLFPQASQRQVALRLLADIARKRGEPETALEIWSLAAIWPAVTREASRPQVEKLCLELDLGIKTGEPLLAMRRFLENLKAGAQEVMSDRVRHSLKTGWEAVGRQVRATSPPPLELVEEVLRIWEMQPQGYVLPEAALLLADILKEHQLLEAARAILSKVEQTSPQVQESRLRVYSLELAWLSRGWVGLADTLRFGVKGDEDRKALVASWLASRLHQSQASAGAESASPGEALLAWFLPQPARAAWLAGQSSALTLALQHPWPFPVTGPFYAELARRFWAEGDFPGAAKVYQTLAKEAASEELALFYQDRLGLSQWKGGQPEAAHTTFSGLAQQNDPFWQCLGQVRLADLELARWQSEVSP
uniref:Tetratricopeptide repeat protein n=1 Tax=Desulfobacca acetoxidans TaxID=60893 RepID=A0A7C5ELF1_9BACT